jgi:DNA polymerase III subunit epsilon
MSTTLFFDTETTGLVSDRYEPTHPRQPMPMQLGMKIDAANRNEMMACNTLIRPEGWSIEAKASEITGITDEMATDYGTHLITACELFLDMVENADVIVAHNINFDITVMRRAVFVYCQETGQEYKDPFEGKTLICTMLASLNLVKATPKRNGQWKWPKLSEAIKFFFNEELEGAHDALVDVRACARVYYELLDEGVFSGEYRYQ